LHRLAIAEWTYTLTCHDSEPKGNTIDGTPYATNTRMDIIDSGQSDDAMTGLDPQDNQQTSQQESATEFVTVVPISYHSRGFPTGPL